MSFTEHTLYPSKNIVKNQISFSDCSLLHPWYLFLCNKQLSEEKRTNEKGFIWVHFPMVSPLLTLLCERTKVQGPGSSSHCSSWSRVTYCLWVDKTHTLSYQLTHGVTNFPFPHISPFYPLWHNGSKLGWGARLPAPHLTYVPWESH